MSRRPCTPLIMGMEPLKGAVQPLRALAPPGKSCTPVTMMLQPELLLSLLEYVIIVNNHAKGLSYL